MKVSQPKPEGPQFESGRGDAFFYVGRLIYTGGQDIYMKKLLCSVVLGLAVGLFSCKSKEEKYYDSPLLFSAPLGMPVQEDTLVQERQSELEDIIEEHKVPYIADIIYFDDSLKERYVTAMKEEYDTEEQISANFWKKFNENILKYVCVTIMPRHLVGKGKDSIILVFPTAYDKKESQEDLVSFIVDHEAVHAKDNATGITLAGEKMTPETIDKMGNKKYEAIMELRAYGHQLMQIEDRKRKVSQTCMDFIVHMYAIIHRRLLFKAQTDNHVMSAIEQAPYLPMIDLQSKKLILYRVEKPK